MTYTTTSKFGLKKAVPGSNQPFETSVINANWDAVESVAATQTGTETLSNKTLSAPAFASAATESFYTTATGFAGYTFYVQTNGAIQYITAAATANGAVNIAASASASLDSWLAVNKSVTLVLQVTNGTTAYYPTSWQIDGVVVTPKWIGSAPSAGNASAIDIYQLTIQKTAAATYTVIASAAKAA